MELFAVGLYTSPLFKVIVYYKFLGVVLRMLC